MISPLARQVIVATATQFAAVSMGGSLGYPSVLFHQLQSNDATVKTDLSMLTWITAIHGIAGVVATLMPTVMQFNGRKNTFIGSCLTLLIGWILASAARDIYMILLSAIFHGLASNCVTIINLVTVSEMLDPKCRSISMVLLSISQTVGIVLATLTGTFFDYKVVAMIMCVPTIVPLLMVFAWPESPSWLACKGKFEKSKEAFELLRGTNDEAMKELQEMIAAQKETRRNDSNKAKLQDICQTLKKRDFYLPTSFMFLILLNFYINGQIALFIYSKDIIEQATGDAKIAVVGYVLTICTLLLGSLLSLLLIKFFKTKTVLSTAFGCIGTLLCCSLVVYLQSIDLLSKNSWLFLYFFLAYMVFANLGFNPMSFALAIDLMPVKHRGIGGALFNIFTCAMYVLTVKTFPYTILSLGISWTFVLFATCSLFCTILVWIFVPETKNRTLQEIEDYYNYGSFVSHSSQEANVSTPIVSKQNFTEHTY